VSQSYSRYTESEIKLSVSSFSIVIRLPAVRQGFNSRQKQGLFATASRLPHIQRVLGAPSPRIKLPECEADHSTPPSSEVKNARKYTPTPPYVSMVWGLVKHRIRLRGVELV
jgi:hypothetical protein